MDSDTVEEIKRHFGVVVEGLRSDFRLVAEGQDLLREELEARFVRVDARLDRVDARLDRVEGRLGTVDGQLGTVEQQLSGLTHIVQLTHSELTGRLDDHAARLDAVERRQP